ncbi:MAG: hypothetical protein C0613_05015 [Desulfobulbaceae bacterium]|nr:MAG: hypothetical protein C0613_05015 [Desulfobulbaceae bacterium]
MVISAQLLLGLMHQIEAPVAASPQPVTIKKQGSSQRELWRHYKTTKKPEKDERLGNRAARRSLLLPP